MTQRGSSWNEELSIVTEAVTIPGVRWRFVLGVLLMTVNYWLLLAFLNNTLPCLAIVVLLTTMPLMTAFLFSSGQRIRRMVVILMVPNHACGRVNCILFFTSKTCGFFPMAEVMLYEVLEKYGLPRSMVEKIDVSHKDSLAYGVDQLRELPTVRIFEKGLRGLTDIDVVETSVTMMFLGRWYAVIGS